MKTQHPSQRLFVYVFCSLNVFPTPNKGILDKCSLKELNVVSYPSQEFGGGGHRNASSFMLSSAELERWKVHKNALI